MQQTITIIGAGLAGCEAAWQLASRGYKVHLYEQKPSQKTEAQVSPYFAELVCSNSLRSADLLNAVGLLKEEMRRLGSLVIQTADAHRIPGGSALVVDREGFAKAMHEKITQHPFIKIYQEEVTSIPSTYPCIMATGPLTSPALAKAIQELTSLQHFYFYDSIAPIVMAESIDMQKAFRASRYGKGGDDYINCPLDKEQYLDFVKSIVASDKVPSKDFEKEIFFEGCLPIEVMATRGERTLAFGPMKAVGLENPHTGKRPYAVVQLRQDDLHASLYNMVGFQTRMKYPDQLQIFRKIPGLEQAEFARLGSMHRNSYISSPELLNPYLELKNHPGIYFAGQITGVEGYVESAAMGLYVSIILAKRLAGQEPEYLSAKTALGSLVRHITQSTAKKFSPMNVNFGLFDLPELEIKKSLRPIIVENSLNLLQNWQQQIKL